MTVMHSCKTCIKSNVLRVSNINFRSFCHVILRIYRIDLLTIKMLQAMSWKWSYISRVLLHNLAPNQSLQDTVTLKEYPGPKLDNNNYREMLLIDNDN